MKTSRVTFEQLARIFYLNRGEFMHNPRAFVSLCDEVASVMARSNPAFNRVMFMNACVTGNKHKGDWRKQWASDGKKWSLPNAKD